MLEKKLPDKLKTRLLDEADLGRIVSRMAHEMIEKTRERSN